MLRHANPIAQDTASPSLATRGLDCAKAVLITRTAQGRQVSRGTAKYRDLGSSGIATRLRPLGKWAHNPKVGGSNHPRHHPKGVRTGHIGNRSSPAVA